MPEIAEQQIQRFQKFPLCAKNQQQQIRISSSVYEFNHSAHNHTQYRHRHKTHAHTERK